MNPAFSVIALLVGITLGSCNASSAVRAPDGATGICYSHIAVVEDNRVVSTHQAIMVHGSGNALADIKRMGEFSQDRFMSNNAHTVPNVWLGAWLSDQSFDFTSGPDCSFLPMIEGLPKSDYQQRRTD